MDASVGAGGRAFRDRPKVEWTRPLFPVAVATCTSAVVFAALAFWVMTGTLPSLVADVLFGLAILLVIRERALFADPNACTDAGVVVLGFGWATAVACGIVVSVQRATWVWGAPVGWWVHILVGLGIVGLIGAVSWATVLACFLVSEDAAFLGASWGVLIGVVVSFSLLWLANLGMWSGMLWGAVAALCAGPPLTVLLRVRLVPVEPDPILRHRT
jgi:hypothetical protein